MKWARIVAALGLVAMTTVLVYGFVGGDFAQEGSNLLAMPWGIVSLVDLYVGFALFSGWIWFREPSSWRALLWTVLMLVLGFWAGSLYVLVALYTSRGEWGRFWMGSRWSRS